MRHKLFLVLLPVFILVCTCKMARLCVKVADDRASSFTLEVSEPCDFLVAEADCDHCTRPASYIEEVTYQRVSDGTPLWRFFILEPSADVKLEKIVYGAIPKGFQGGESTPLVSREPIEIQIHAVGRETSITQVVPK